ncbi:MAG: response regulator [Burkholderiales bacterium]|nr:response regulator [Burkholderiales bacterium]
MIASNVAAISLKIPLQILHLEDSALDHALVRRELARGDRPFEIERVETLPEFVGAIEKNAHHIVLADYRLPGFTALDAWMSMSQTKPEIPFILLSGAIGEAAAVNAIQMGISDYLHKDELHKLWRVIYRALEVSQVKRAEAKANLDLMLSEKRLAEFAEHLQTTIESERASIAREIHDDIGGALAAVKLDLGWLARHTKTEDAQGHIQAASEMLQHALGASQRIMMNLRPAILDQGLLAAMQWLIGNFEKRTGINTAITFNNESLSLARVVELAAYRTTQEALTNISKHANCTQVQVELSDAEGVLTIEITDNGQGIASSDLEKPQAFGLRGLRERAKSVGGWLDVSSTPGAGTSIILSVPLSEVTPHFGEDQFQ